MNEKFALVLGASGEIGQSICRSLAEDGWSLYMHYNTRGDTISELIRTFSPEFPMQNFIAVQADFTKPRAAEEVAIQIGAVRSIVVANGHTVYKLLSETTVPEMEALWQVHVQNPVRLISLLSPKLRAAEKPAYIVFIGSIWGETGSAGEVLYSTVKGAQHAFVKAYAKEAAFSKVLVNAIAPGWIDTNMNNFLSEAETFELASEIPLQRPGKPSEIGGMVQFLLSGRADYMTGQIVHVNGGWYI
jgi:3-oxoacyl-[acyl-carrier protein] reductase